MASQRASQNIKQSEEERRILRQEYRTLTAEADERVAEFSDPNVVGTGVVTLLQNVDRLFESVQSTREGVLDAHLISRASNCVHTSASGLKVGKTAYGLNEFMLRLKGVLSSGPAAGHGSGRGNEEPQASQMGGRAAAAAAEFDHLNWRAFGKLVLKSFPAIAPSPSFINGGLAPYVAKQRVKRKVAQKDIIAPATRPMDVTKIEEVENATGRRVQELSERLHGCASQSFWTTTWAPEFGKTVENLFHASFLVNKGSARVSIQREIPVIEACSEPTPADFENGTAKQTQGIISLNYKDWVQLSDAIKAYQKYSDRLGSSQRPDGDGSGDGEDENYHSVNELEAQVARDGDEDENEDKVDDEDEGENEVDDDDEGEYEGEEVSQPPARASASRRRQRTENGSPADERPLKIPKLE